MSYKTKNEEIAALLEERAELMQKVDELIGKLMMERMRNEQLVEEVKKLRKNS